MKDDAEANRFSKSKSERKRLSNFHQTNIKSKKANLDVEGVYFTAGRAKLARDGYDENYYVKACKSTSNDAETSRKNEMIDYLTRVNDSFERKRDEEIKHLVSDVLSTIEGDEVTTIEDVRTNPILRKLVLKCDIEQLLFFLRAFSAGKRNFDYVSNGKESAAFLEYCSQLILDKLKKESRRLSDLAELKKLIYKLIEMTVATSGDKFLYNIKAIHLVKKLLLLLIADSEVGRKNCATQQVSENAELEQKEMKERKDYVIKLAAWVYDCDLQVMLESASFCALLVVLFNALGTVKAFKLVRDIFVKCFMQSSAETEIEEVSVQSFQDLCCDKQTNVVIEAAIKNSRLNLYKRIFNLISGYIGDISKHSSGNYIVQQLLLSCPNEEYALILFQTLKDHLPSIMESGYCNIFNRLLQLCSKFASLQPEMYSVILDVFRCKNGEANIFELISYFMPSDEFKKIDKQFLRFTGSASQSIQHLFSWTGRPLDQLLKSFSNCDDEFFIQACCDKSMSYAIEALFQSQTITKDVKAEVLNEKFFPNLATIAKSAYGSFLVETVVKSSSSDTKFKIMENLISCKSDLQMSKSGFIVTKKLFVDLFERNSEKWMIKMHSQ